MAAVPALPDPPPRRRRRLRWLALVGLLGMAAAVWLDGPGIRWLGRLALERMLPRAGLAGEFRLDGTLLGGVALREVHLTGDQAVRQLDAGEVAVSYRLTELVRGRIRGLRIHDLSAVIDRAKWPADETTDRQERGLDEVVQQIRTGLVAAHEIADPLEIELRRVAVDLRDGDAPVFALGASDLTHPGPGAPVEAHLGPMKYGGTRTLPPQRLTLNWTPTSVELAPFNPVRNWLLREVRLDTTGRDAPLLRAALVFEGRRLELEIAGDARSAATRFRGDPLPWSAVAAALGINTGFDCELRRFNLTVSGLGRPAIEWRSTLDLAAGALAWRDWRAGLVELQAGQQGTTAAADWTVVALGGTARGTATTSWPDAARLLADPVPPEVRGTLEIAAVHEILAALRQRLPLPRGDAPFPGRTLAGTWSLAFDGARPAAATAEAHLTGMDPATAPPVRLDAKWRPADGIEARLRTAGIDLGGRIDARWNAYQAALDLADAGAASVRAWAAAFTDQLPAGLSAAAAWRGQGHLNPADHHGTLELQALRWAPPNQPATAATGALSYRFPAPWIEVARLHATRGELAVDLHGKLAGNRLELTTFTARERGATLATGTAAIPLADNPTDWRRALKLDQPWQVDLTTSELAIERINRWLGQPLQIPARGTVRANLQLAGSPARPVLTAGLTGIALEAAGTARQVPPADLTIKLETRSGRIEASGKLQPRGWSPLVLAASAPLDHAQWLDDPQSALDAKLEARAEIPPIDLARLGPLPAAIKRIAGTVEARVGLTGSVRHPRFDGTAALRNFALDPVDPRLAPLRNGRVELRLDRSRITLTTLDLTAAGGRLRGNGNIDLDPITEPAFDLRLDGSALPAWRDASTIVRVDTALRLSGKPADAVLSGRVALVQSLFFRDFELIPVGIPFTTPRPPSLPKLDAPATGPAGPRVPDPFAKWSLDLTAVTKDPFLIRGNLAQGTVTGEVRVGGTLGAPAPQGGFTIEQFTAQLPLSRLQVRDGRIRLRPEAPFDPALEIRGTSNLRPYEVNVFVSGTATAPKVTFTANPPLPENEILTLLATGATSADLERGDLASSKAIHLLIEEARRGRLRYAKFLRPVLEVVKDVEVRVGEADPYTGRDFTSATLRMSDRWLAAFALDDEGRSRGVVIFVLRFR